MGRSTPRDGPRPQPTLEPERLYGNAHKTRRRIDALAHRYTARKVRSAGASSRFRGRNMLWSRPHVMLAWVRCAHMRLIGASALTRPRLKRTPAAALVAKTKSKFHPCPVLHWPRIRGILAGWGCEQCSVCQLPSAWVVLGQRIWRPSFVLLEACRACRAASALASPKRPLEPCATPGGVRPPEAHPTPSSADAMCLQHLSPHLLKQPLRKRLHGLRHVSLSRRSRATSRGLHDLTPCTMPEHNQVPVQPRGLRHHCGGIPRPLRL